MRAARVIPKRSPTSGSEEAGQAILEYVLLLTVVVSLFLMVLQGMDRLRLTGRIAEFVTGGFKKTYQFGHPDASFGGDSGGESKNHPRVVGQGSNNFRIFLRQE